MQLLNIFYNTLKVIRVLNHFQETKEALFMLGQKKNLKTLKDLKKLV